MLTLIIVILISIPILIQSTETSELIEQNNRFSLNLLHVLPKNQNNFFSPLSITHSLYMLLNGANGRTLTELQDIFNIQQNDTINSLNDQIKTISSFINNKNSNDTVLQFANRILLSDAYNLSQSYSNVIKDKFNSDIDSVDFVRNAANITDNINDWISKQTNGKIDKLFETLSNDTLFVITNALYFSGLWDYPFDSYSNTADEFHGLFKTSTVQYMRQSRKFRYSFDPQLNASLVELPFKHESNLSMIILYPNETNDYNLKHSLKQLGLNSVFESSADLSGITGNSNIKVSKAVHKAVFKVTESGAEASAAVGIVGVPHIWIPPVEFKINKPFLFLIQDNTSGLVLFMGQVLDI